jgi:hypothetical protein
MGGTNESILKSDKKESVLSPDLTPSKTEDVVQIESKLQAEEIIPVQTQVIRQHMSNGQIHLHVDNALPKPLKVAIPVAEWFLIIRSLQSLNPYTFIDKENKCVAYLKPYIYNDLFEVSIELKSVEIGPRFVSMNTVAKR